MFLVWSAHGPGCGVESDGDTMMTIDDYRCWFQSFEQLGMPGILVDTAARILAAVHSLGNNEQMSHCPQLRVELEHIRKMYGINGGEIPDARIVELIKRYIDEIESSEEIPRWVEKLFKDRYGIKLYK